MLIDLFVAPAFGFPIMSGGPRFGLFFAAIGVGAVVFTLIVKALRRNRAVHLFEDRLELVEGSNRRTISLREARRVVFDPARRRLQVGRDGIRLSPGDGLAVVRALAEQQEAQPSHSTSAERGASATRPEPSGP